MNKKKIILVAALSSFLTPALAGCASESDVTYLRVLNSEEYIYVQEDESEPLSMTEQFEIYCEEVLGQKVKVIYDTFDTNETMLNTLKTGKATYDLVCPSDYVIQKMITLDMIEPYDFNKLPNYSKYCPEFLRNVFKGITALDKDGNEQIVDKYAVGYMWGTLGILYNPTFEAFVQRGYSEEKVMEDMEDWNSLWNKDYKGTISIKDSMRDTYSVGIMRVYDEEFNDLRDQYYGEGDYEEIDKRTSIYQNDALYNQKLSEYFNKSDSETVNKVQKELLSLKENIFGFEVDSGKEDINTGKIGINIAWSGDAVYAMDKGDGFKNGAVTLYYSIPKTGGNIWFDGWVMPKSNSLKKDLAHEFVDFMSNPEQAMLNMYGVGYTPFIGGDPILDYNRMLYDVRAYYLYQYDDETEDFVYDDEGDYVRIEGRENLDWNDPEVIQYALDEGSEPVDLSYMFTGTKESGDFDPEDMIFYPTELGRQFSAQYPTGEEIKRLAVMQDFGANNKYILDMWENVKTNSLPLWAIILLITEIAIGLAFGLYFFISKKINKKLRLNRRKAST